MALRIEGDIYTEPTSYHIDHVGTFNLPQLAAADTTKLPVVMFRAAAQHLAEAAEAITAIESDTTLSDFGKERKLDPLKRDLIAQVAHTDENVDIEERHWNTQEAALLKVPDLDSAHTVMAIEDREIRDWWRSQPAETRHKLMEQMKAGPAHERLMIAILRSPIPEFDHEKTFMRSLWNQTARLNNPGQAAAIEVGRAQVEWARRGIFTIAALTNRVLKLESRAVAEMLLGHEEGRLTSKAGLFGIERQEMEILRRIAEQRASAQAASR